MVLEIRYLSKSLSLLRFHNDIETSCDKNCYYGTRSGLIFETDLYTLEKEFGHNLYDDSSKNNVEFYVDIHKRSENPKIQKGLADEDDDPTSYTTSHLKQINNIFIHIQNKTQKCKQKIIYIENKQLMIEQEQLLLEEYKLLHTQKEKEKFKKTLSHNLQRQLDKLDKQ